MEGQDSSSSSCPSCPSGGTGEFLLFYLFVDVFIYFLPLDVQGGVIYEVNSSVFEISFSSLPVEGFSFFFSFPISFSLINI